MTRTALVTTALPYANGPLHLGHLVGYIQADIWVRARRLRGDKTWFVCADDTHGTPIMLAAEKAGVTPEAFIASIQASHERDFAAFGVTFDHYDSTNSPVNRELTEAFYTKLEGAGHISRRSVAQFYDPAKGMFLPDRYIKGICPNCGSADQYGDNCEVCGATYAPTELKEPKSVISGATPELRDSEHFFFEVGHFDGFLREWLAGDVALPGVKAKLKEWLDTEGGLRAWDISRDAPYFGFQIPGQPGKYFYVWLDAPIGYLCSFKTLCAQMGEDFASHLRAGTQTELHHFIGKDIVNFHGLFWPAVLHGTGHRAPTRLHVNGYLTVDGAKMSKSRGTFVMARTFLDVGLEPEALRYYFAAKSSGGVDDLDLNLGDFIARVNADLVGKFVNLASRCAGFIGKRFDGKLAEALPDAAQYDRFVAALAPIREAYERNDAASAIRQTMALADEANKYIDDTKPWVIAKQDGADAQLQSVCTQGLNLFRILVAALKPILPRTCAEAEAFLSAPMTSWEDVIRPLTSHTIQPYTALFTRIDPKLIDAMTDASKDTLAAPAATSTKPAAAKADAKPAAPANPESPISTPSFIGMDDFAKLDLRIGKVLVCEFVEGSDKLLRFELDAGELGKRQIFSGIRASYGEPETLVGRSVVFIANLAPRKMRFGISEGMILSAGFDGGALALLDADSGAQPGMPVR
ncbi:TPA: methionine--tRNA ligase [Xanthomonas vasicola pv. zeae]|uniref:Methionine--tRNA ligase n=3 Tax=Xanthomonas vasicola TaxID=56459 RepID=A0A836P1P5_XANVA|nr:methionine--tRNA ligase [Xanthomonas vasicola]AVQ06485.1 methionine--tRNA ligase [Xanthomonas vasicola pv. vasculorum]AZM70685.1 methionine--tRNA ligase [Xanthomonas vasicola pv. vasculorum]KFA23282.1 methionyl-tRNA synthetase [Xanthomonas vasicola pv. vasculorum NCPPB 1326]MBV6744769.1 methionine--tRNA ligase [Xanthomonas vasicola pv. vasculorum NCPPB 890]MBV6890516.1 methionine--tRNA ligase [Xanthomonas vasicola pv. vasculorum]